VTAALVVDCAGQPDPAALAAAGVDTMLMYLRKAEPSSVRNIVTAPAVRGAHDAGLAVGLLYEDADPAFMVTGGRAGGVQHAKQALAGVAAAAGSGLVLRSIYFAADEDVRPDQYPNVAETLRGINTELPPGIAGIYGESGLLDYLAALPDKPCYWFMQSAGWDLGHDSAAANIRQTTEQREIGGTTVDVDQGVSVDYGQWPPPAAATPPEDQLTAPQVTEIEGKIDHAVDEIRTDTPEGNSIANIRAHQDAQGNELGDLVTFLKSHVAAIEAAIAKLLAHVPANASDPAAEKVEEDPAPTVVQTPPVSVVDVVPDKVR
jgi:hypothetical protein